MYRKTILLLSCAVLTGIAAAAAAQNAAPPAPEAAAAAPPVVPVIGDQNTQAVASIVNDYVISDFDVNQRTALFIATSGLQRPAPEALAQIRQQVLRALEDETLQLQEASKRKLAVKKAEVDTAVETVAKDNNLTVEQLTATLRQSGVSMNTFRSQLTAQIAWNRLVEARYAASINVTEEQVDAALNRLKEGANKPQFQVAEIFLGVDRPQDDAQVRTEAEQIAQQLNLGAGFQNVARQFSRAPSAASGGNIGWVQQGQLPAELDKALTDMQPGQISPPIKSEGGYYILLLADRREPVGTTQVEIPKLDPAGPIPLDRFLLPLSPDSPDEVKKQALAFAETLRANIRSCGDLPAMAQQAQGSVHMRLGAMRTADLAPEIGEAVGKTAPGGVTAPVMSDAGVELFVRCDPAVREVKPFVIPTREDVTQQLFVQQLTVLARSYLRDLRRDAVVETR